MNLDCGRCGVRTPDATKEEVLPGSRLRMRVTRCVSCWACKAGTIISTKNERKWLGDIASSTAMARGRR